MFTGTSPDSDPHQFPADAYWQLVHTLRLTLPPPVSDSAEDLARRDRAAIARVAALAPANAAEADLAGQFVAASEQWKDCLRLAQAPQTTPEWALKCRAQAIGMMRQANSALRLLLRMQDTRRKLEADGAAADRLAWAEHCALGLMAEALAHCPSPASAAAGLLPKAEGPSSPLPMEQGQQQGAAAANPGGGWSDADLIAGAERYAAAYPERAASIRRTGRLPHGDVYYFDPPEAALGRALVSARTPALVALDALPIPAPDTRSPPPPMRGNCAAAECPEARAA